jgi:hypothetical protein
LFREWIGAGTVRELPVEQIIEVISDLLFGTMFINHFTGRKMSPERPCEDVPLILYRGLLRGLLTESKRGSHE